MIKEKRVIMPFLFLISERESLTVPSLINNMINNEFYFNYSGWSGELYMKINFPVNIEKAEEFLSDSPIEHPDKPFIVIPGNVTSNKRFAKTSRAKESISINRAFLTDKAEVDESKFIEWFTKGEKQERYLHIDTKGMFSNYRERRQILDDFEKTKNPIKIVEKIKAKGLGIHSLMMTGPKFKLGKAAVPFNIDGDITIQDLIDKDKRNHDKIKQIAKFFVGGTYRFRFLDYDE